MSQVMTPGEGRVPSKSALVRRSWPRSAPAKALAALGFAFPIALYLWVIRVYGVNAIFYDQWTNIALLSHSHFFSQSYAGPMSLGHLWAQHNENRMLFPNLVVLVLGSATHLNIATELYVSAAMLVVATALIVLSHRDSGRATPWIFYCPVAVLMFSLAQIGNTLFGFQMAWYLIMLALAVTLYLLERRQLGWLLLCGAAVAAVVGSFSSFAGLIIWPAGLVVLVVRRSRGAFILAWIASAVATTGVYFYHFDAGSDVGYPLSHPESALKFFFLAVGDVLGNPLRAGASGGSIMYLGVVIVAIAASVVAIYGRRSREEERSSTGLALICFGLLFAVSITVGRSKMGLSAASQTRYVTFDLLILVGCYLVLLDRWPFRRRSDPVASRPAASSRAVVIALAERPTIQTIASNWRGFVLLCLRALLIGIILFQFLIGTPSGLNGARSWRKQRELTNIVSVQISHAPDWLIQSALFPDGYVPGIRQLASDARVHRLGSFAGGETPYYARSPLPNSRCKPSLRAQRCLPHCCGP